ncbi:ATP synthase I subunit [Natranaerovirga hydrolytica]|uniref:ATP synthase I subunit n=1 Tax=Natranaerovirga hydrolytica TaxID=680378 RepID=A0A4R1M7Z1_9FIRM|nr:ATP synthase subunit I [Natranaerovirga hydrolytica]TCK87907.1 ATP synthase I subunit [Natranaerovirga hydrolytica]
MIDQSQQKLLKGIIKGMLVISLTIIIISFVFFKNIAFVIGVIVGTLTAILQLIDINKSMNKALDRSPEKAKSYTIKKSISRYFIIMVILILAIKFYPDTVVGIIIGLFLLKMSIYLMPLFNKT